MPANETAASPEADAGQKDVYELKRDEMKEKLIGCQKEQGLESCYPCEKILGCELRTEYVNSVYASMSKGDTGGFDF